MKGLLVEIDERGDSFHRLMRPASSAVSVASDPRSGRTVVLLGRLFDVPDGADEQLRRWKVRDLPPTDVEGEFASILIDDRARTVTLIRDPLGSWPLHFRRSEGVIRISARADEAALPNDSLNETTLARWLLDPEPGFEPATSATFFDGVERVAAGTAVTFGPGDVVRRERWWDWTPEPLDRGITFEEAAREAEARLRVSVARRIRGRKVAAHLSGGMDSSTVFLLAAESGAPVTPLSLVWSRGAQADEWRYQQAACDVAGSRAVAPIRIEGSLAAEFDLFSRPLPSTDEPHVGLFRMPAERALVEAAAESGCDLILTGAGADSFFEGEPAHLADDLLRHPWRTLGLVRRYARSRLMPAWRVFGEEIWQRHRSMLRPRAPAWIRPEFVARHPEIAVASSGENRRTTPRWSWLILRRSTAAGSLSWHADMAAIRRSIGDRTGWHLAEPRGILISRPFLDPSLIRWLMGLPRSFRCHPEVRKLLLRRATERILPPLIRDRQAKIPMDDAVVAGLVAATDSIRARFESLPTTLEAVLDPTPLLELLDRARVGLAAAPEIVQLARALALVEWCRGRG